MKRINSKRLRSLRERRRESVSAVIRALHAQAGTPVIHRHTLARWESDNPVYFDYNGVQQLAQHYGVEVESLLSEDRPRTPRK